MGYINNYGQTIGPVKIENIWAGSLNRDKIYLAFVKDVSTLKAGMGAGVENFAPLLAETPASSAPDNAVATIEWVKQYTTVGNQQIDLSKFATKNELNAMRNDISTLQHKIESMENNTNYYVEELERLKNDNVKIHNDIEINSKNILDNANNINLIKTDINNINSITTALNQKITINTADILKNANDIAVNTENILNNTKEIEQIKSIIDDVNNNSSAAIEKVNQMQEEVLTLKNQVATNSSNILEHSNEIINIKETLEEYGEKIDNPFPNGIMIVCGGATLNAS